MNTIEKLAVLVVCWLFTSLSTHLYAQTVSINLSSAGTLSSISATDTASVTRLTLTGFIDARDVKFMHGDMANDVPLNKAHDMTVVTHLTITGDIDARDIKFMRDDMPYLTEVDLSEATIVEYNGEDGTSPLGGYYSYPDNEIPQYSFSEKTSLISIILPGGITSIDHHAFYKSGLTSIIIPDRVTSIGNYAFSKCSKLTSVTLQTGISFIGEGMFSGCTSLASIVIPDGVTSIGNDAFYDCHGLNSVTLPAGLSTIGDYAFGWCNALSSITNQEYTPIYINSSVFESVDKGSCRLLVPSGSDSAYRVADVWKEFYINGGYAVITNAGKGGNVTGGGFYSSGAPVTVEATPITGYQFVEWTSNEVGGSTQERFQFNVTQNTTLTANFKATPYNISYTLNGGTDQGYPVTYTVEDSVVLQAPTKTGCNFTGWKEGDGVIIKGSTGDRVFTAMWSLISYTITYELNGGTNHTDNPTSYTIENATITLQNPTRGTYVFNGWYQGTQKVTSIPAGSTGNKEFTAQWLPPGTHFITYNLNGGTNHASNPNTYNEADADISLQNPSKPGYTFAGWSPSNTILSGSTTDMTFTAQWTLTSYTITYELNGGVNHAGNPANYTMESATVTLQAPTRKGYEFTGWSPGNTIPAGSTGNKTFTATWKAINYKITYVLGSDGVNDGNNPASYIIDSPRITLKDPGRRGYTFTGWTPGNTIETGSTGDTTFTAQWTPTIYAITYELNGGVNHADNPANYTAENAVTLQAPTKKGYDFTGWEEGDEIAKGSIGDTTFTATWKATAYNINYKLDGGENHIDNPATYTIEDSVTLKTPTKTGYEFMGWKEGDEIAKGSIGDTTFTATWKATAYNISYELAGGENHANNPATYTVDDAVTLQSPAKTGYEFTGWQEGDEIAKGSIGDKTFTATWKVIVYNISYELDGGENHADNPAIYTVEDAVTLQSPTKAGYMFTGWSPSNTIEIGSEGDKTFTATWKVSYNIIYELDGGENHADNPATYVSEESVTLKDPSKKGYEFTGWSPSNTIEIGSTGDKTFTATWKVSVYNIIYELDGGENHADNPATYVSEESVTLKDPSKKGYEFTGWSPNNTIEIGSEGDKTFTATWEVIVYSISYELDGGENHADNPATYTVEDAVALKDPSKTGCLFEGWNEGGEIAQGSTGNTTFTATWKCIEANIIAIAIDGTDITDNENNNVFEYTPLCGQKSITLTVEVSPNASVKVNEASYPSSGVVIASDKATTVSIFIISETGDTKEYSLKIAGLIDGSKLFYQRWSNVLAIKRNSETNGGISITGVHWYKNDGTDLGTADYIEIQGSASDYYADIQTGGEWRRVCQTGTKTSEKVIAYPNPVPRGEKITLQLPESFAGGVLNIYNITGMLVKSGQPLPVTSNSIDVSEHVPGIYLLRVTDKNGNHQVVKIIIE